MALEIYLVIVDELDAFRLESVPHHIGVTKMPSSAQETNPIDYAMTRQLELRRWCAYCPSNHPRGTGLSDCLGNCSVGRYATKRYLRHEHIDSIHEA